jgi:AraC family transcriptional regulator of adaptative response/methylated-DNA-[protein]-cysteine methyltransferase
MTEREQDPSSATGPSVTIRYAFGQSALGVVLIAAECGKFVAVLLGEASNILLDQLQARFPRANLRAGGAEENAMLGRVLHLAKHGGRPIPGF